MPIKIRLVNSEVLEKVGKLAIDQSETLLQDIVTESGEFGRDAVAIAKRDYLSGPRPAKLGHKSGTLASRMTSKVTQDGQVVKTAIGNNLVYAPIHEFGGRIRLTDKMRKFSWAMFFKTKDDKWKWMALAKKSFLKIPARPFLRPAVQDAMPDFRDNLRRILLKISFAGA